VGVFEGMLSIWVTTVVSVTEQNDFFRINESSCYEVYSIDNDINPTAHPHDPCATLRINNKQQNVAADAYGAPSQNALPRQKRLLRTTFDRYVLIRPPIRSHDPIVTHHSNDKRQNIVPDTYGAFPSSPISLPSSQRNNDDD